MFLNLYCYLLRQVFNSDEYKKTISIPIVNDHEFEPDTDFYIILRNPEGDAGLGDPSVARVTIFDDDGESPARMWCSSAGGYCGKNNKLLGFARWYLYYVLILGTLQTSIQRLLPNGQIHKFAFEY